MAGARDAAPPLARRPQTWLLALALVAGGLHAANLLYVARAQGCESALLRCPEQRGAFATPDTQGYLRVARTVSEQGVLAADYYFRPPGYPMLLAAAVALSGEPSFALWLAPLLAAAAAVAIAWTTARLTERRAAGVAAGVVFCLWLNVYQYASLLLTDAVHALLVVCAVAATLAWRESERAWLAPLAALLWMAVQSLRMTFIALPAILPLALCKRAGRRYAALSLAIWLASWILPVTLLGANLMRHGRILPPQACYAVPRLQEELGLGSFRSLREACIEEYRIAAGRRSRLDAEFLAAHTGQAIASFAAEIRDQLLHPLEPGALKRHRGLYPGFLRFGATAMLLYWALGVIGLIAVARTRPGFALFLAGIAAVVMLPAGNVHWVGARIRLPVDLVFIAPVVAGAIALYARLRRAPRRNGHRGGRKPLPRYLP